MKLINKKKIFLKNSLFNTLNLNRSKILKKKITQYEIKKKYGNFYSGIYISNYNKLFESNIKNYYIRNGIGYYPFTIITRRGHNSKKLIYLKKIFSFFLFISKSLFNNFLLFVKILIILFLKKTPLLKKKNYFSNTI